MLSWIWKTTTGSKDSGLPSIKIDYSKTQIGEDWAKRESEKRRPILLVYSETLIIETSIDPKLTVKTMSRKQLKKTHFRRVFSGFQRSKRKFRKIICPNRFPENLYNRLVEALHFLFPVRQTVSTELYFGGLRFKIYWEMKQHMHLNLPSIEVNKLPVLTEPWKKHR